MLGYIMGVLGTFGLVGRSHELLLSSASRSRPVRDETAPGCSFLVSYLRVIGKKVTVIPEIETCELYLTFNFIDNSVGDTSGRGYLLGRRLIKIKHVFKS